MPVVEITDIADPRLSDFAHRTDVALKNGSPTEHGLYIAESALVLGRALRAGHRPRAVLALGGTVDEAVGLVGDDVPVYSGPADLLADARRIVVLENVVDPTNVGAIFRSVAAIGADAVLVTPRCSDPFYRRAIRVSMGTVLQVPWTRIGDWATTRELLADRGFHIAALALTDDAVSLREFAAAAPDRVAIVLGTEGDGLTPEAIAAADTVVKIPMAHGIDSLNVAATAAVAMYALAGS
jgi:tRNA(Leu) C34 or U34 (ribose-2'-O)-methylase TrmL